jgi:hypothetical protein
VTPAPVVPIDVELLGDALRTALDTLAGSTGIEAFEGEGPEHPDKAVPYVVWHLSPGQVDGYPFEPGRELRGTISLQGVGGSAWQARSAVTPSRVRLLADDIAVEGYRLSITPDDAEPPYPERDDSITPPLFTSLIVFDYKLD